MRRLDSVIGCTMTGYRERISGKRLYLYLGLIISLENRIYIRQRYTEIKTGSGYRTENERSYDYNYLIFIVIFIVILLFYLN